MGHAALLENHQDLLRLPFPTGAVRRPRGWQTPKARHVREATEPEADETAAAQEGNDALMATSLLKSGFRTDVEPILAMARLEQGGAIDPVATYRASGYRARVAEIRPKSSGAGGGIV